MIQLPSETKVYKCEYCNRLSVNKGGMVRHEICCKRNPINKTPCASCKYLDKAIEYYDPYGNFISEMEALTGYEHYRKVTQMLCIKKNLKLYHPRIMRFGKERAKLIISQCDMQMPTECGDYKWNKV